MITSLRKFHGIYIHPDSESSSLTKRVLSRLDTSKIEIFPWEDPKNIWKKIQHHHVDSYGEAKRVLLIQPFKGQFVKRCPGGNTKGAVCCNYYILNFMSQCPFDCSYCYLQDYLTNPLLTLYSNTYEMLKQLEDAIHEKKDKLRIGTGEIADSLAMDHLTDFSLELCEFFDRHPHANLELKTKSATIENLLKREGRKNITISWSMNPSFIQKTEEHFTASIDDRIAAAKLIKNHGYSVAFHFDPLMDIDLSLYEECFEKIVQNLGPEALQWISLGVLRMTETLKDAVDDRFPDSPITLGEFIKSPDGKFRYAKPIRVEIFKKIYELIKKYKLAESPIYLCMESRDAWDKALGGTPRQHPLFGAQ